MPSSAHDPVTASRGPSQDRDALAQAFAALAIAAGAVAMEVFERGRVDVRYKDDNSPVCEADERVEALLLHELARLLPGVPIVAEESAAAGRTPAHERAFLLVDPLDGTREFIAHGAEFTINIALVEDGAPRAGAIFAPALARIWFGGARAFGVAVEPGHALPPRGEWRTLRARRRPKEGMVALVSRSHLDEETLAFLDRNNIRHRVAAASSLKFCRLAEGEADVYPRYGPTMEWDTAAGDAILRAAGGVVLDPAGRPFRYGKADQAYRNGPFIAWGDAESATLS
jgi:3'(2'), 5'-bisphosphate nucleotidase